MNTLVWLQRELRIQNHPALEAALTQSDSVYVVYFHDPNQTLGDANTAWLGHSLQQLQQDFQARQGQLWIHEGDFEQQLAHCLQQHSIDQVFYTYQLGQPFQNLQQQALQVCRQHHVKLVPFETEYWLHPSQTLNRTGQPYKVFTPFYNQLKTQFSQLESFDEPVTSLDKTVGLGEDSGAAPRLPEQLQTLIDAPWAKRMMAHWQVGETAAWEKADRFIDESVGDYPTDRDFPHKPATSQLSPHLHFGELHSRALLLHLLSLADARPDNTALYSWIRQLGWREFARHILWHFPHTETEPFQDKFRHFFSPLDQLDENQRKKYPAWCHGKTGIPIIDAGMNELWQTGWMHNRVRMLVASWLTKNAHIHWLAGVNWFNHTLVDADPANNLMGWQWVAGCGVDAAPYYRLFNPVRQSEKFNMTAYIRRWVPELANLDDDQIHAPGDAELNRLKLNYPKPVVDLTLSRQQHLEKVEALKGRQP